MTILVIRRGFALASLPANAVREHNKSQQEQLTSRSRYTLTYASHINVAHTLTWNTDNRQSFVRFVTFALYVCVTRSRTDGILSLLLDDEKC